MSLIFFVKNVKLEVIYVAKDTKEPAWVDRCTSNVISEDDLDNDEALCQVSSSSFFLYNRMLFQSWLISINWLNAMSAFSSYLYVEFICILFTLRWMQSIDVVYSYTCLCVGCNHELCKNGSTDWDATWRADLYGVDQRIRILDWVQNPDPHTNGQFWERWHVVPAVNYSDRGTAMWI